MRKARFTEEQIAYAQRSRRTRTRMRESRMSGSVGASGGSVVPEAIRRHGMATDSEVHRAGPRLLVWQVAKVLGSAGQPAAGSATEGSCRTSGR
jgi:hypothetical protein